MVGFRRGLRCAPAGPAARLDALAPLYSREGSVGMVNVALGRAGAVVAGEVGGVITGWVTGTVTSGTVVAVRGATVVAGASSTGSVVVVAEDDDPDEDPADDPELLEPEDSTEATGAGVRPERSGTLSGGVASAGLALDMKLLKICA